MALFTYDVSLEQVEMPEPPDSTPPTPGNDHPQDADRVGPLPFPLPLCPELSPTLHMQIANPFLPR